MRTTLDLALTILNKISESITDPNLMGYKCSFPVDEGFDVPLLSKILAEYGGKIEEHNAVYDEWEIKVFDKITVNAPYDWNFEAIFYYGENRKELK